MENNIERVLEHMNEVWGILEREEVHGWDTLLDTLQCNALLECSTARQFH